MNNEIGEYKLKETIFGEITVEVFLDSLEGDRMEGVRINLYRINGVSPQLECSKFTDVNGIVVFDRLVKGNYRVIELIDKEIYKKPVYISWNEVNISNYTKSNTIKVINKKK